MSNDFLNWNNHDYCYYYENFFPISLFGDRKKKYSEYQS